MKLDAVKIVKPKKNLWKKGLAVAGSVIVFVVAFLVITNADRRANETVSVIRVKAADGIPARTPITADNVEIYGVLKKEWSDDMVSPGEGETPQNILDNVLGLYTTASLSKGRVLLRHELISTVPRINEYLYEMSEDLQLLTIPYNYMEAGGTILKPGDRIRVRAVYEDTSSMYTAFDSENPNISDLSDGIKVEIIFDSIMVVDFLNSGGNSIYEMYDEVMKLPENQRREAMKTKEFTSSIVPRSLGVMATDEQVDAYARFDSMSGRGKSLKITILSREGSTIILDQLPTLQNEVEAWLEKKN